MLKICFYSKVTWLAKFLNLLLQIYSQHQIIASSWYRSYKADKTWGSQGEEEGALSHYPVHINTHAGIETSALPDYPRLARYIVDRNIALSVSGYHNLLEIRFSLSAGNWGLVYPSAYFLVEKGVCEISSG